MKRLSTIRISSGFSIVELLVAILIILMLVGISFTAYRGVMRMYSGVTAKNEMVNLATALEQYKNAVGEYPPDGTDPTLIRRHILKRWPDMLKKGNVAISALAGFVPADSAEALHFWLCGPWRDGSATCGFSTDRENPFGLLASGANVDPACDTLQTPFIDLKFDTTSDGQHRGNSDGKKFIYRDTAIVYFRAEKTGYLMPNPDSTLATALPLVPKEVDYGDSTAIPPTVNCATPYMQNGKWLRPDSYQLIHAGGDENFGTICPPITTTGTPPVTKAHPRDITNGSALSVEDNDNITNFTEGALLESMLP